MIAVLFPRITGPLTVPLSIGPSLAGAQPFPPDEDVQRILDDRVVPARKGSPNQRWPHPAAGRRRAPSMVTELLKQDMGASARSDCPECGARGVGGEEGCNRLFREVMGREFSRPELFQVHRLTVDAYSLQHPDRYMRSAKSAVAHLTGMCWAMEGRDDPSISLALSRFLDGTPQLTRPEPIPTSGKRGTSPSWTCILRRIPPSTSGG